MDLLIGMTIASSSDGDSESIVQWSAGIESVTSTTIHIAIIQGRSGLSVCLSVACWRVGLKCR